MRNLIPILLAVVVLSSGCDSDGYSCTSEGCYADDNSPQYQTLEDCLSVCEDDLNTNNDNVDYFFEIEFGGETHRIQGNTADDNIAPYPPGDVGPNSCYTFSPFQGTSEWITYLTIGDVTANNYISGHNLSIVINLPNPQLGSNSGSLQSFVLSGSYFTDYLESLGVVSPVFIENGPAAYGTMETIFIENKISNINITDLGTQSTSDLSPSGYIYNYGETVKGSYEGVLYFLSADAANYDIPVPITIEFNSVRHPS